MSADAERAEEPALGQNDAVFAAAYAIILPPCVPWQTAGTLPCVRLLKKDMASEYVKDSYCSYCGAAYPEDYPWPRRCPQCRNATYRNPLSVSVVLLPIDDGLLLVRRTQNPQAGKLALPGGYIEVGETWQEAGAREVREETGFTVDAAGIRLFDARSAPDGTLLVFGLAPPQSSQDMPPFVASNETSEMAVAPGPLELAFLLHTEIAARYWKEKTDAEADVR